jgi:hypothetical protein
MTSHAPVAHTRPGSPWPRQKHSSPLRAGGAGRAGARQEASAQHARAARRRYGPQFWGVATERRARRSSAGCNAPALAEGQQRVVAHAERRAVNAEPQAAALAARLRQPHLWRTRKQGSAGGAGAARPRQKGSGARCEPTDASARSGAAVRERGASGAVSVACGGRARRGAHGSAVERRPASRGISLSKQPQTGGLLRDARAAPAAAAAPAPTPGGASRAASSGAAPGRPPRRRAARQAPPAVGDKAQRGEASPVSARASGRAPLCRSAAVAAAPSSESCPRSSRRAPPWRTRARAPAVHHRHRPSCRARSASSRWWLQRRASEGQDDGGVCCVAPSEARSGARRRRKVELLFVCWPNQKRRFVVNAAADFDARLN